MLLAEGRIDMVAEFDVKEYDVAAAVPIVREAGGRMTGFDGAETISDPLDTRHQRHPSRCLPELLHD